MYRTCIFCNGPLGSNPVVEPFPVGRRLAFDPARGRLWVVCRRCRGWNLTPVEERWEAIEECDRIFSATPMRASTENIALARHPGGLELIRIGSAPPGEFAAWRYGRRFGARFRGQLAWSGFLGSCVVAGTALGGTGIVSALLFSPVTIGLYGVGAASALCLARMAKVRVGRGSPDADGALDDDSIVAFRLFDLRSLRLLPDEGEPGFRVEVRQGLRWSGFAGEDARRVAAAIMPSINLWGGSETSVRRALHEIESVDRPDRFLAHIARVGSRDWLDRTGYVRSFPDTTRLAIEMALNEERERRALEGELWILEQAWKEAEEIAAIADNLLIPARVTSLLARLGGDGRNRG